MSDKDCRTLEMLRIYIKSDSERIAILRKIGSQHTIKSLNKTQKFIQNENQIRVK